MRNKFSKIKVHPIFKNLAKKGSWALKFTMINLKKKPPKKNTQQNKQKQKKNDFVREKF